MEQTQSESALLFCVLVKIVSYTSQNQKNTILVPINPEFSYIVFAYFAFSEKPRISFHRTATPLTGLRATNQHVSRR